MRVFLLTLLLLLYSSTLPLSASAASATLSKKGGYVYLKFSDLKNVSRMDWTVYYNTSRGQKGFTGGRKLGKSTRRYNRTELLGTRSSKYTTFHQGVKNITADITFTLRSGGVQNVTKSLP